MPSLQLKVLVVDDQSTMRKIMRGLLEQMGISLIEEARDGCSALDKLREADFDLVIADWNMGAMNGLDLLKEVRADSKLSKLPFIMVTVETKKENVAAARAAGVSNYIVKPFTGVALRQRIEAVLGPLAGAQSEWGPFPGYASRRPH